MSAFKFGCPPRADGTYKLPFLWEGNSSEDIVSNYEHNFLNYFEIRSENCRVVRTRSRLNACLNSLRIASSRLDCRSYIESCILRQCPKCSAQ